MHLLQLPVEILQCIAREIEDFEDLWSLCCANERLFFISRLELYRPNFHQRFFSLLYQAVRQDRDDQIQLLVGGPRAPINDMYKGMNTLMYAACRGSHSIVDVLLARCDIQVNAWTNKGKTALWYAVSRGHSGIVKKLLGVSSIEIDRADLILGWTPFATAVANGNVQVVRHLLNTGKVNLNSTDSLGRTPIFYAIHTRSSFEESISDILQPRSMYTRDSLSREVSNGRSTLLQVLWARKDVARDLVDHFGRSLLWYAVRNGNTEAIRSLVETGLSPTVSDMQGVTPLRLAVMQGELPTVEMILRLASLVAEEDHHDGPLLCLASKYGHAEIVKLLISHGANVNAVDSAGRSALSLAAESGHSGVVKVLLVQDGVNVGSCDTQFRSTAIHEAARGGHFSIVKLLLCENDVDVNVRDRDGKTPLWWATYFVQLATLAPPDAEDGTRQSPTMHSGHTAMVERLLAEDNIEVNVIGRSQSCVYESSAPLHHLVNASNARLTRLLLLEKDMDPNIQDQNQRTPLWIAAEKGDSTIADTLLSHSATNPNIPDDQGRTPLCIAASRGHADVVRSLLCLPATDLNRRSRSNESPLLVSLRSDHLDVARELLQHGDRIDTQLPEPWGGWALSVVEMKAHRERVDILLRQIRASAQREKGLSPGGVIADCEKLSISAHRGR